MSGNQEQEVSNSEDKPYAVWELYNEKARTRDKELLKDWDYNINSLLLFAAIFASVLTAFCVETRKLLEQDPLNVIQQTVLYIAERDQNISTSFPSTAFEPPLWAIAVNAYFFASLSASILAAIGAVMCQQWVGEYDAGLEAASTPEQRALRGHYRYRATKNWYMHQLIAALPILLYISVAFFFVGLAVWFRHVHPRLALIPLIGLLVGAVGYIITTMLTVFYPSAPYRTSMSRLLFRISWLFDFYIWYTIQSIRLLWRPFMEFLVNFIKDAISQLRDLVQGDWTLLTPRKIKQYRDKFIVEKAVYSREMKMRRTQAYPWIHPSRDHWQSMYARIWERASVARDDTIHIAALTWLANSIHLSSHSKDQFKLLLKELSSMDEHRLRDWAAYSHDAPWSHIFNLVLASSKRDTVAKSPTEVIVPTSPTAASRRQTLLSMASLGAAPSYFSARDMPVSPEEHDHEMVPVLADLLRKMTDHPALFDRMISRMSETLIVALMDQLVTHRPSNEEQAMKRLKSLTALFSSKRWQRMDHSLQPVYATFKVLLDCLKVGEVCEHDKSTTWLFTLCHIDVEEEFGKVPWPNPEFIGVISYAFRHEDLRRRAIEYYIDYIDALLTKAELPLMEYRRWRWHNARAVPSEGFQTAMLQILAEYLLQSLVSAGDPQDRQGTIALLHSWSSKVRHPALRMIIHAYETREYEDLPPDMDDLWESEAWLYAATFSYRLRGKSFRPGDEPLLPPTATQVMVAILVANKPSLTSMLDELLTTRFKLMTAEHWIAIMGVLSRRTIEEVESYADWMIELAPGKWLSIFNHFFEAGSEAGTCNVTEVLLRTLRDYLPDRLAQKRWRAAVDRLFRSQGRIEEFRQVVDIVWLKARRIQPDDAPLVTSPLPALLRKIHGELSGVRRTEDIIKLAPYIRILDDLTAAYEMARSIDEDFLLNFRRIAVELEKIRELIGGAEVIEAAASVHGSVSLARLLSRISQFKGLSDYTNEQASAPTQCVGHSNEYHLPLAKSVYRDWVGVGGIVLFLTLSRIS